MKKILTSICLCILTTSLLIAQCPGPAPCTFAGNPNTSFESLPAVIPSPTLCPGVPASFDISVTGNAATGDDQYITLFVDFDCDGVLETSVNSFCDFVAGVGCDVTITVPTPNVCENTTYNARAVLQFANPITAGSVCGPIPGASQYGDSKDFTITVGDEINPTFTAPANQTLACGDPIPPIPTVTASDNCDASITMATATETMTGDACTGIMITRTWTVPADACGNTAPPQTQVISIATCGCGCTDPCFVEYDPTAITDDGSCVTTPPMTACDDGNPCTINDMEVLGGNGSSCAPCIGTPVTPPIPAVTCPPSTINVCDQSFDCMFRDDNPATDGNGVTDNPIISGSAAFATSSTGVIDYTQLQVGATYNLTLNYEENGCFGTPVTCTFTATVPNQAQGGQF